MELLSRPARRAARILRCAVPAVLGAALLLPAAGAPAADAAAPGEVALPTTLERVWYRGEKKPLLGAAAISGELTISPEALEIHGRKDEVVVPMRAVRGVSIGKMRGDVDTDWIVVEVDRGGVTGLIGLRDGMKFGYGLRTREIYETIKSALRQLNAGRYAVPAGYVAFEALEQQLTLALPDDWSWYNLSMIEVDERTLLGTTIFTAAPIVREAEAARDVEEVRRRVHDARSGAVPAFLVDRRPADRGMSCDRISKKGRRLAAAWSRELLEADRIVVTELTEAGPTTLGGCEGLRFTGRVETEEGRKADAEVRAVAGPRFVVLLARLSTDASGDREPWERALETFRFSAAR